MHEPMAPGSLPSLEFFVRDVDAQLAIAQIVAVPVEEHPRRSGLEAIHDDLLGNAELVERLDVFFGRVDAHAVGAGGVEDALHRDPNVVRRVAELELHPSTSGLVAIP